MSMRMEIELKPWAKKFNAFFAGVVNRWDWTTTSKNQTHLKNNVSITKEVKIYRYFAYMGAMLSNRRLWWIMQHQKRHFAKPMRICKIRWVWDLGDLSRKSYFISLDIGESACNNMSRENIYHCKNQLWLLTCFIRITSFPCEATNN